MTSAPRTILALGLMSFLSFSVMSQATFAAPSQIPNQKKAKASTVVNTAHNTKQYALSTKQPQQNTKKPSSNLQSHKPANPKLSTVKGAFSANVTTQNHTKK